MLDRRSALKLTGAAAFTAQTSLATSAFAETSAHTALPGDRPTLISSTQTRRWARQSDPVLAPADGDIFALHFAVEVDKPKQTMAGFGGAFSARGWTALGVLDEAERGRALDALFGAGARLSQCRLPLGASDFALSPYSYDEVDGDFAMEHFDLGPDRDTLIPFVKAAQAREPGLRLWASPWTPPRWMKTNGAFEMAPGWPGRVPNAITEATTRHEGEDAFIQKPEYLAAYARYFGRYVDAYAREGIAISAVMPQNEWNSAQPYVSCVWTPEGLARFLPHLGREMAPRKVDVLLGTLERGNADLVARVLADPAAASVVKGLGVQWAGKEALPTLHTIWPDLPIWGTEQECGLGTNDWNYARYNWRTMLHYLRNGTSVWTYWNMALDDGGESSAGWPQNSLLAIDTKARSWRLTHDYWVLRHASALVHPGARYLPTSSAVGYEFQFAFRNPDGSLVVVMMNDLAEAQERRIALGSQSVRLTLPGDSFSTLVVPAALLDRKA